MILTCSPVFLAPFPSTSLGCSNSAILDFKLEFSSISSSSRDISFEISLPNNSTSEASGSCV